MSSDPSPPAALRVEGARRHNLQSLSVSLPLRKLIVVTGVSGAGKSSLAFDTLWAEGQRRYVESFSTYARQFLQRIERPPADLFEGVPPAVAIERAGAFRTSRSTLSTMTEIADYAKLLWARLAQRQCVRCGGDQRAFEPGSAADEVASWQAGSVAAVGFRSACDQLPELRAAGFIRALSAEGQVVTLDMAAADAPAKLAVVVDRVRLDAECRSRLFEAFETAFSFGHGIAFACEPGSGEVRELTQRPRCQDCGSEEEAEAVPPVGLFSFNSPVGACQTCRGFGRTIEIDPARVVPDASLSITKGAVKPLVTRRRARERRRMLEMCRSQGIETDVAWADLRPEQRRLVMDGDGKWRGVRGFFRRLERKSYRMHVRVLLARYRGYVSCADCGGSRMCPETGRWRLSGHSLGEFYRLTVDQALGFVEGLELTGSRVALAAPLREEMVGRLRYLLSVGLGYLTLSRQSRTLSGGERARAALAASLGASLVDTLFVLDEPTTGLHARDTAKLVSTLRGLRDASNTVVVVEHDPDVVRAADQVVELGPNAGTAGGQLVYQGPPAGLVNGAGVATATADYLSGRLGLPAAPSVPSVAESGSVVIRGACANNLDDVDIEIPLRRLVTVTGVSGSGKSSLVEDVLVAGLKVALRRPDGGAGPDELGGDGDEDIDTRRSRWREVAVRPAKALSDLVLVSQVPLTQSGRSSLLSFVGGHTHLRTVMAATADARRLGLAAADFSTNTGKGRCQMCRGAGFERVEMQFLPDLRVRCPECRGRRFRDELLRVRWRGHSVADLLETTVDDLCVLVGEDAGDAAVRRLRRVLEPLSEMGLGYLEAGRSLDGLSTGEAQRLKLVGALTGTTRRGRAGKLGGTLFVLDEPTNGLHMADVDVLCRVLDRLLEEGHSLVVVEHHPQLIARSNWVIDLGPEGGDGGGRLMAVGSPEEVARCPESRTGAVLDELLRPAQPAATSLAEPAVSEVRRLARSAIVVRGARAHNLRSLDVDIPRGKLVVLSGPSGSGKSTLAHDILFAEGRRRYLETLSPYARRYLRPLERPEVEVVAGVPPTVAIEQRETRAGRKSTVATVTEIHAFLRVLYARCGQRRCPDCDVAIKAETRDSLARRLVAELAGRGCLLLAPLVRSRKGEYRDLIERLREDDAIAGVVVDGEVFRFADHGPGEIKPARYTVHDIEAIVLEGRMPKDRAAVAERLAAPLEVALDRGDGTVVVQGPRGGRKTWSTTLSCPDCGRGFEAPDPRELSFHSPRGWCPGCRGTGLRPGEETDLLPEWGDEDGPLNDEEDGRRDDSLLKGPRAKGKQAGGSEDADALAARQVPDLDGDPNACSQCRGARLRPESLAIRVGGLSIAAVCALSLDKAADHLRSLTTDVVSQGPVREAVTRLEVLDAVGLSYLSLDRSFGSLSGGEQQRVKLGAQIGAGPCGVLYILDEPTIGLHARDTGRLLDTMRRLRDEGSSVLVVEHDEDVIRAADVVVDMGPGGGRRGGEVVAVGPPDRVLAEPRSHTAQHLGSANPERRQLSGRSVLTGEVPAVGLRGVRARNIHGLDVDFPLAALTVVSGVSGSGKSTLVVDVLSRAVARALRGDPVPPGVDRVTGVDALRRVAVVDSSPIGRTSRSIPLTYVNAFTHLRKLFAAVPEARARGWGPGRFSFNVKGGRCDTCRGLGRVAVGMSFLPGASLGCDACSGARYHRQTLAVRWKGLTIADVLALTVEEAVEVFSDVPRLHRPLSFMKEIGLGYLSLGQSSAQLSGGEAQRVKLAAELASGVDRRREGLGVVLYILDEPTTGLSVGDVARLVGALRRLTERGHGVVVIEHNLEVIKAADCLVDLGPEGGPGGGQMVAWGSPADLLERRSKRASAPRSHTLEALEGWLSLA